MVRVSAVNGHRGRVGVTRARDAWSGRRYGHCRGACALTGGTRGRAWRMSGLGGREPCRRVRVRCACAPGPHAVGYLNSRHVVPPKGSPMRITKPPAPTSAVSVAPRADPGESLVLWCLDGPQTVGANGIDWLIETLRAWCFGWADVERELVALCARGAHTRDEQTALSMLLFYSERLVRQSPHAATPLVGHTIRYALLGRVWGTLTNPPEHIADNIARAFLNAKATLAHALLERACTKQLLPLI